MNQTRACDFVNCQAFAGLHSAYLNISIFPMLLPPVAFPREVMDTFMVNHCALNRSEHIILICLKLTTDSKFRIKTCF